MADCNYRNTTQIDTEYVFCDYTQRLLVASIFTFLSILGVFGNTLVILAVAMSRKLRSATNIFVTNLSIADLISSAMFSGHAAAMVGTSGWPLPEAEWLCSVVSALTIICLGCTTFTLAFIALNRVLLITKSAPFYRNMYTKCKMSLMIGCSWIVPLITTLFPPYFGLVKIGYDYKHKVCTTDHSKANSNYYDLILAAVYYPLPFMIMCSSYLKIVLHVRQHVKHTNKSLFLSNPGTPEGALHTQGQPLSVKSTPTPLSQNGTPPQRRKPLSSNETTSWTHSLSRKLSTLKQSQLQVEITKNTFLVVCAFGITTTPFTFCVLVDACDAILPYFGILLLIGSCVNPLIYSTRHPQFRQVFRCILTCRFGDIPEPSQWMKHVLRGPNTSSGSSGWSYHSGD